jgi:hypothetical protein
VVALLHDYRAAGLWRRKPIAEIHVEGDEGVSLYVGEGRETDTAPAHVRLGPAPYRDKLERLRKVFDELDGRDGRVAYVFLDNMRRPDRVTVRLR